MLNMQQKHKQILRIGLISIIGSLCLVFFVFWLLIPANYNVTLDTPFKDATSIPIGVAVDVYKLENDKEHEFLVRTHFNSIVAENAMKMGPLRPTIETFYWDEAEYLVDYAESIGATVHGHCLVWHEQVPDWVESFEGTKEDWENLLRTHIQTVVSHFKGRVASWDVVNEAINPYPFKHGELLQTVWLENIGPEYIKYAFIWAHEADPDAVLYYNDYHLIHFPKKLEAVLELLNGLIAEGVPIHGLGFQGHLYPLPNLANQVQRAVERVNREPFKVRISELDLEMNPIKIQRVYSVVLAEYQARLYESITKEFLNIQNLEGITLWGLSDKHSWLRSHRQEHDWPLLFDDEYKPKPAAERFLRTLQQHEIN